MLEILHSKNHIVFQKDILKTNFYEKLFELAFYFRDVSQLLSEIFLQNDEIFRITF